MNQLKTEDSLKQEAPSVTNQSTQGSTPSYHGNTQQVSPGVDDDDDHVKRPMNAFMVWSRTERRKLALKYPNMLNCEISKLLGAEWSRMGDEEKQPYIQESKRLRTIHSQKYPDYSYKPRRRKRKAQQNHNVYPPISFPAGFPTGGPVLPPYQFSASYPKMMSDSFRLPGTGVESPYHSAMSDQAKAGNYFNPSNMPSAQDMKYFMPGTNGSAFPPTSSFPNMSMGGSTSVSAPNNMYSSNPGQYAPPLFKDHTFSGSI
eukprot:Seg969.6 transcript_id=Seg969.6/GoldUCD/mRNA.D3Y31 product="Transcription factor Sox-19b" protein_id=Seg969.6/GoldUCD/D3Y31